MMPLGKDNARIREQSNRIHEQKVATRIYEQEKKLSLIGNQKLNKN